MKYLKKFKKDINYIDYINGSEYITPNVSYVIDNNIVYYQPLLPSLDRCLYYYFDESEVPTSVNINRNLFKSFKVNGVEYIQSSEGEKSIELPSGLVINDISDTAATFQFVVDNLQYTPPSMKISSYTIEIDEEMTENSLILMGLYASMDGMVDGMGQILPLSMLVSQGLLIQESTTKFKVSSMLLDELNMYIDYGLETRLGMWIGDLDETGTIYTTIKNKISYDEGDASISFDVTEPGEYTANVEWIDDINEITDIFVNGFYLNKLTTNNEDLFTDITPNNSLSMMFGGCTKLTSLKLNKLNTSNVTIMSSMFSGCTSLTSLDLSNWDTSKVTNMSSMFYKCYGLTSLDLSNWNTSDVTDMYSMFYACSGLTSLDLSNWDTSDVTNMSEMFGICYSLTSLNLSNWDTSNVTNMRSMFSECRSLTSLNLSNWDTSKVTDMREMFEGCSRLTSIDLSNWDLSSLSNSGSAQYMFNSCSKLTDIKTTNMVLPVYGTNDDSGLNYIKKYFKPEDIATWDVSKVTNMRYMFYECTGLTSLDLSNWDVSNMTNMMEMFYYCTSLTSVGDLSNWDVSNVTNMCKMFQGCTGLTSLDLSNWDVSNVTNMGYMFSSCYSLTSLDLSNWDTSEVTNMDSMFYYCRNLTEIKMGGDVSNVTDVSSMFSGVASSGTFYYNSAYDYSNIIAKLPTGWTSIPCILENGVLVPVE